MGDLEMGDLAVTVVVDQATDGLVVIAMDVPVTDDLVVTAMVDLVVIVMDVPVTVGLVVIVIVTEIVVGIGIAAIGAVIDGMDLVVRIALTTAVGMIGTTVGIAGTTEVTGSEAIMALGSTTGLLAGNRPGEGWRDGTSSTIARARGSGGAGVRPLA